MSYGAQQTALVALVASASGIPVAWANQQHSRPTYPYVSLNLIAANAVGFGDVRRELESGQLATRVRHDEEVTLSVNVCAKPGDSFDVTALAYMNAIRRCFTQPSSQQKLRDADLALLDLGNVQDLSRDGDGGMILRSQMDVRFNTGVVIEDAPTDYIERVQATIHLTEPERTIELESDEAGD